MPQVDSVDSEEIEEDVVVAEGDEVSIITYG